MTATRPGKSGTEGVLLGSGSREGMLNLVDSVVFDCDGTLIDVSNSFDATIARTASTMLRKFSGARVPLARVAPELIMKIRRTGGFNNDWDTTYALALFAVAALDGSKSTSGGVARLKEMVSEFSSEARTAGARAVDEFLAADRCGNEESLLRFREFLGYPGTVVSSLLARVFDETYLGSELFRRVYGMDATHFRGRGLIEEDRLLINRQILSRLVKALDGRRIAISTGRSSVMAEHTLGALMEFFDRRASVFIGDMDVNPDLAEALGKYRKPSGASLMHAREELSSSVMLYAGDSAEDMMMVEDVRRSEDGILFVGVYGTAADQMSQREFFVKGGADLVVKAVSQLPGILEMVKR